MKLEGQVAGMKDKFVRGFLSEKMEIFTYDWENNIKIYLEEMTWTGVDQIG
jgi:hypothetical protein